MDYEVEEGMLRDFVTLDAANQRGKGQVVHRATLDRKEKKTESWVVMVDQLWLWILDDSKC